MAKLDVIRLKLLDPECRACGHGHRKVCDKCNELYKRGYAFFIEVTDKSTSQKKKPTGYAVAIKASKCPDMADPSKMMEPGLYFIKESDLKKFLKDEYNKPKSLAQRPARFLSAGTNSTDRGPARGPRSATEIRVS